MDALEIPRCHYCNRLAPELTYETIAVCRDCIKALGGDEWSLYQRPDGEYVFAPVKGVPDAHWTFIAVGTYDNMHDLANQLAGSH